MVEIINALKNLISELERIGPMGIAILALIVALAALWILSAKL